MLGPVLACISNPKGVSVAIHIYLIRALQIYGPLWKCLLLLAHTLWTHHVFDIFEWVFAIQTWWPAFVLLTCVYPFAVLHSSSNLENTGTHPTILRKLIPASALRNFIRLALSLSPHSYISSWFPETHKRGIMVSSGGCCNCSVEEANYWQRDCWFHNPRSWSHLAIPCSACCRDKLSVWWWHFVNL